LAHFNSSEHQDHVCQLLPHLDLRSLSVHFIYVILWSVQGKGFYKGAYLLITGNEKQNDLFVVFHYIRDDPMLLRIQHSKALGWNEPSKAAARKGGWRECECISTYESATTSFEGDIFACHPIRRKIQL